jgi:hypothetical protein
MIRKAIVICILIFLFLFCLDLTPSFGSDNSAEESAGYALLDSLVVAFKELAEMREAVIERTENALVSMMREARNAKAQGQIDDAFFKRFHRILMIIKCVITPVPKDDAGIMKPLYFGAINDFIEDIEGEPFGLEKVEEYEAINKLTEAISHEIINLRLYLDNKEKRQKLEEKYIKEMGINKEAMDMAAQKDRQSISMKDIGTISMALSDYAADHGAPPKQSGAFDKNSTFYKALVPFYIKVLPGHDGWGNGFLVYSGKACNGVYEGIKGCTAKDFIVVSFGSDRKKDNWTYNQRNPRAGLYEIDSLDDFNRDLIMWNGTWIKAPMKGKKKK